MGAGADSALLSQLFAAAGYRLAEIPGGWAAVRARDRRSVVFSDTVRSPTELESSFAPDAIHRALLFPQDPGEVARGLAAERGIEIFDPSTLGSALGELLLLPPAPEERPTSGHPPSLEAPPAIFPEGDRIVRARLSRPAAEAAAGAPELRATLRLVPFYVAPYRVRTASAHGERGASTEHIVAVNALLRAAEGWEATLYELDTSPAEVAARLEPTITTEQASSVAVEWIRSHHTIRVEHTEQHGGTVVVETRRVPPSPDDLRLAPLTLVYVPYWYFEGAGGRIVLNAVTGERYSPEGRPTDG